jgi:hypothetical protein
MRTVLGFLGRFSAADRKGNYFMSIYHKRVITTSPLIKMARTKDKASILPFIIGLDADLSSE